MVVNEYKDTTFYLLDTDKTYHVDNDGIQFWGAVVEDGPPVEIPTSQE